MSPITSLDSRVLEHVILQPLTAAMVKVCEASHRYKVELPPDIRRYRVPGFLYNIIYRQVGTNVEVLVVAPHRRRPDYWLGRL